VVLPYPRLVKRVVESQFGCHERTRALNVAISAVFTDDPQGYIGDVLAQLCMPYLEYCEDVRRYVKLFEVVEKHLAGSLSEYQEPCSERLVTIRNMTIEQEMLVFVVQHIRITG
jgi:hypothetical protein